MKKIWLKFFTFYKISWLALVPDIKIVAITTSFLADKHCYIN